MKKVLTLFAAALFFQLVVILMSCECRDKVKVCHDIANVTLSALDNAGMKPEMPKGNNILANAFILRLEVTVEQTICRIEKPFFISKAYALTKPDCSPDYFNDEVTRITLVSNNNYDSLHPAGTDLSDIFKLPKRNFIGSIRHDIYPLKTPDDTGIHVFKIRLHMADSSVIEATTVPVKLLK